MPEDPAKKTTDQDDIKARFAGIEESSAAPDVDLPPVPQVRVERPKVNAATGGLDYGGKGNSDRIVGARMFGGGDMRSSGAALTIGTSLVASIVVGTGLGWLADKYWLHAGAGTPWGMIVGFIVGVASGFMNLIRVANQINRN